MSPILKGGKLTNKLEMMKAMQMKNNSKTILSMKQCKPQKNNNVKKSLRKFTMNLTIPYKYKIKLNQSHGTNQKRFLALKLKAMLDLMMIVRVRTLTSVKVTLQKVKNRVLL